MRASRSSHPRIPSSSRRPRLLLWLALAKRVERPASPAACPALPWRGPQPAVPAVPAVPSPRVAPVNAALNHAPCSLIALALDARGRPYDSICLPGETHPTCDRATLPPAICASRRQRCQGEPAENHHRRRAATAPASTTTTRPLGMMSAAAPVAPRTRAAFLSPVQLASAACHCPELTPRPPRRRCLQPHPPSTPAAALLSPLVGLRRRPAQARRRVSAPT